MARRERVDSPLRAAAGGGTAPPSPSRAASLPLRELTGWEEEYLERHQHELNTARTCDEVLARCCVAPGVDPGDDVRARVRGLLVAERDRELVRLRRLSLGPDVEATVSCPSCGEVNEARFSLDDLELDPQLPDRRAGIPVGGDDLTITLPTAGDQEELLDNEPDRVAERRTWLLGRCLRTADGTAIGADAARALPVQRRAALESVVDDLLPALDLEMAVTCVQCAAAFEAPFDFGVFFFRDEGASRRSAAGRPPSRHQLPLGRAADLGSARPATSGVSAADRGAGGCRPVRGSHPRPRHAELTRAAGSA